MTQTELANLALDLLGEPYLSSYDSDTGTTADAVRLHYPVALKSLLESHPWSFATACSQLTAAPLDETYATVTLSPAGDNNDILFTAVTPGPSGNDTSITIAAPALVPFSISTSGQSITITTTTDHLLIVTGTLTDGTDSVTFPDLIIVDPTADLRVWTSTGSETVPDTGTFYRCGMTADTCYIDKFIDGVSVYGAESPDSTTPDLATNWSVFPPATGTPTIVLKNTTAEYLIDTITADDSASLLVTAENASGSDGTGEVATVAATHLSGGTSTSSVYAPAYGSAFNLPDDCVRLLKIDDVDIDAPRNRFEIQGRHLLLEETNAEAPVIHYIQASPPIADWPSTFTDAFVTLLAHRLSAKLCQNDNLKQSLRNDHQLALAQAKNKDARETRSKENHGPRALAARSGLVAARFTRTAQPPYSAS